MLIIWPEIGLYSCLNSANLLVRREGDSRCRPLAITTYPIAGPKPCRAVLPLVKNAYEVIHSKAGKNPGTPVRSKVFYPDFPSETRRQVLPDICLTDLPE
jgi:hypothetical protein